MNNIVPLGQYFGATTRRAVREARRTQRQGIPTPSVASITQTTSRADVRRARQARRRGDGLMVLPPAPTGPPDRRKRRKSKTRYLGPPIPPAQIINLGGGALGACDVPSTVGTCLQCCANTYGKAKPRKACKRACRDKFAGGGGGATGCGTQYTCPDGSCAPNAAACRTGGQGTGCGIVCVSGTHGNQQDCHYECPDYGGGAPPLTPDNLGGVTPLGGNGGITDGTTDTGTPADFWTQYQTPILIAGGVLAAIVVLRLSGKRSGR